MFPGLPYSMMYKNKYEYRYISTKCNDLHNLIIESSEYGMNIEFYEKLHYFLTKTTLINEPDEYGFTPLALAVELHNYDVIKLILLFYRQTPIYINYYPNNRPYTVKEHIVSLYPTIMYLIPPDFKESIQSDNYYKSLLGTLHHNRFDMFLYIVDVNKLNFYYNKPYYSTFLELACQSKHGFQFVDFCISNGCNPNYKNKVTGIPLLHNTVRAGNLNILLLLLKYEKLDINIKDNNDSTILHWICWIDNYRLFPADIIGECYYYIKLRNFNIKKCKDVFGLSPLDLPNNRMRTFMNFIFL